MQLRLLLCCSALMLALSVQGGIIYSPANPVNANIPDGNPAGWSATATVSGFSSVQNVTVHLQITGGYNGDLYAYLSHGGVLVPLLNRVGVGETHAPNGGAFGWGTEGMHVTLADGSPDIHWAAADPLTGTYAPDGRQISPLSAPSAFDAAGTIGFSAFNSTTPNGTWTLFFADLSSGATSQLTDWSLTVPEPVNVALGIFAGVFLILTLARSGAVRNRLHHWRAAVIQWINAV